MKPIMFHRTLHTGSLLLLATALLSRPLFESSAEAGMPAENYVQIRFKCSDTMLQLASAWAEAYHRLKPGAAPDLNGDGPEPGFGVLELVDMFAASRGIKKEEAGKLKAVRGKDATEFGVAYEGLAVYA